MKIIAFLFLALSISTTLAMEEFDEIYINEDNIETIISIDSDIRWSINAGSSGYESYSFLKNRVRGYLANICQNSAPYRGAKNGRLQSFDSCSNSQIIDGNGRTYRTVTCKGNCIGTSLRRIQD